MRMKKLVLLTVLIIIFGCNKDNANIESNIDGQYIGTFERNGNTSNVKLDLINGEYSGESEIVKFPAICNGSYIISSDLIKFENQCAWTAEFDWSLILSESWNYTFENNILTMVKSNGDKYILIKQE